MNTFVKIAAVGFTFIGLAGCAAAPATTTHSTGSPATSSPYVVSDTTLAYKAIITADLPAIITASSNMPGCSTGDFALCRSEVSTAKQASQTLLTDMGTVTAPSAYSTFDSLMRQGLAMDIDGCTEQIAGIDNLSAAQVQAGTDLVTNATTLITQAVTIMPTA